MVTCKHIGLCGQFRVLKNTKNIKSFIKQLFAMPTVLIKNNYNNLKTATKSWIRIVRYKGQFLFCVNKYDSKHLYLLTATHIIFSPNVIDPNSIIKV